MLVPRKQNVSMVLSKIGRALLPRKRLSSAQRPLYKSKWWGISWTIGSESGSGRPVACLEGEKPWAQLCPELGPNTVIGELVPVLTSGDLGPI